MLMAFVGREQSVPSPSSRTCNPTVESFIFSNSGRVAIDAVPRCAPLKSARTADMRQNFEGFPDVSPEDNEPVISHQRKECRNRIGGSPGGFLRPICANVA